MNNLRTRLRRDVKRLLAYTVPAIPSVIGFGAIIAGAQSLPATKNTDLFQANPLSIGITSMLFVATFVPLGYGILLATGYLKPRIMSKLFAVLMSVVMLPATFYFLAVPRKTTLEYVKQAILVTHISWYLSLALLVAGLIYSAWLINGYLKRSPWYVFLITLPYVLVYAQVAPQFSAFNNLLAMSSFTTKNLYLMLNKFHGNLLLMNTASFSQFAIAIFILAIWMGVSSYAFIWKKTKNW